MKPLERVRRRLRGEPVDRRPNFDIYMQRGAHHAGRRLRDYYLDHRALVEANLAVLEAFDLDVVQAISDPYREASDLGLDVEWPDDGLPLRRAVLLQSPEDAARIRFVAPEDGRRMSDRLDAIRLLRERVGDDVPVMGWVEGSFALASVLRGDTNVLLDVHDRPEWLTELLERLVEVGIAFVRAQVAAGAHVIGLGDSMGSLVSPRQYRQFVLPYEQRLFAAAKDAGAIPRLHICGDTNHIVPEMARERRRDRRPRLDGGPGPGSGRVRSRRPRAVRQLRPGRGDAPGLRQRRRRSGAGLRRRRRPAPLQCGRLRGAGPHARREPARPRAGAAGAGVEERRAPQRPVATG